MNEHYDIDNLKKSYEFVPDRGISPYELSLLLKPLIGRIDKSELAALPERLHKYFKEV